MSEEFNAKMKLLIKTEKTLLKLEIQRKSRQVIWVAIALLAILVSLVMLNVTAYFYLKIHFSNLTSSGILSGINIVIATVIFTFAFRQNTNAEIESIEEIRDYAWEQISSDIEGVKQDVSEFRDSIVHVKKSVDSFTNGDAFGLNKFIPIITTLIDINKKKK